MKLRNKKTGEIRNCQILADGLFVIDSISKLNEEWEDYEEYGTTFFINAWGRTDSIINIEDEDLAELRAIGNCFETEEEAEKAVEKLKAWKRLKDARFEFGTVKYNLDEESSSTIAYDGIITIKGMAYEDFVDDLDLLFGGEE